MCNKHFVEFINKFLYNIINEINGEIDMAIEEKIDKMIQNIASKFIKPNEKYDAVTQIDLEEIKKLKSTYGIGGIILDIDGTVRKDMDKISDSIIEWMTFMRSEFKMCIVSNGMDKYVKEIADNIGVNYISLACKPMRKSFIIAANNMGLEPENILVIGNEYISDIFGGNRTGMRTAVVKEYDDER